MRYHFLTLSLLIVGAGEARATSFVLTDLGSLGGSYIQPTAVNDAGQVVGNAGLASGQTSFLWLGGTMTNLGDLGFTGRYTVAEDINANGLMVGQTYPGDNAPAYNYDTHTQTVTPMNFLGTGPNAIGVNDLGQIVGRSYIGGLATAVLWQNGVAQAIGGAIGGWSEAYDISNIGAIVGANNYHPFWRTSDGVASLLPYLPGKTYSGRAYAINDSNEIVGWTMSGEDEANQGLPAYWLNGAVTGLATLGGDAGQAFDINQSGAIVGQAKDAAGNLRATYWDSTHNVFDLNALVTNDSGWVLQSADAINNNGQIAGYGTLNGETRAFLLTVAVPEPGTIALALVSLGGLLMRRAQAASAAA